MYERNHYYSVSCTVIIQFPSILLQIKSQIKYTYNPCALGYLLPLLTIKLYDMLIFYFAQNKM